MAGGASGKASADAGSTSVGDRSGPSAAGGGSPAQAITRSDAEMRFDAGIGAVDAEADIGIAAVASAKSDDGAGDSAEEGYPLPSFQHPHPTSPSGFPKFVWHDYAADYGEGVLRHVPVCEIRKAEHIRAISDGHVARYASSFRVRGYNTLLGIVTVCLDPTGARKWLIVDGGHRLAAMKVLLEEDHPRAQSEVIARVIQRSDATPMSELDAVKVSWFINCSPPPSAPIHHADYDRLARRLISAAPRCGAHLDLSSIISELRTKGYPNDGGIGCSGPASIVQPLPWPLPWMPPKERSGDLALFQKPPPPSASSAENRTD